MHSGAVADLLSCGCDEDSIGNEQSGSLFSDRYDSFEWYGQLEYRDKFTK